MKTARRIQIKHSRLLIGALAFAVLAGAVIGMLLSQRSDPAGEEVREIRRYFTSIRQRDREDGLLNSIAEHLMFWPRPFPDIAARFLVGDSPYHFSEEIEERIVGYGTVAIPILGRALERDRSAAVRQEAASLLGRIAHPAALESLMAAWHREQDEEVQDSILQALTELDPVQTLPILLTALQSDLSPSIRSTAAWALGDLHDHRIAPALMDAWNRETDRHVLHALTYAMGESGAPEVQAPLVEAVQSASEPGARRAAATALGRLGFPESVPILLEVLKTDADPEVRRAATLGLRRFDAPEMFSSLLAVLEMMVLSICRTMLLRSWWNADMPNSASCLSPGSTARTSNSQSR
jgi:HEAT repeat protein